MVHVDAMGMQSLRGRAGLVPCQNCAPKMNLLLPKIQTEAFHHEIIMSVRVRHVDKKVDVATIPMCLPQPTTYLLLEIVTDLEAASSS